MNRSDRRHVERPVSPLRAVVLWAVPALAITGAVSIYAGAPTVATIGGCVGLFVLVLIVYLLDRSGLMRPPKVQNTPSPTAPPERPTQPPASPAPPASQAPPPPAQQPPPPYTQQMPAYGQPPQQQYAPRPSGPPPPVRHAPGPPPQPHPGPPPQMPRRPDDAATRPSDR